MIYAVIDTNVLVSSLLTKKEDSPTVKVMDSIRDGLITPLYHKDMITEYIDVLNRPKFNIIKEKIVNTILYLNKYF